MELVAKGSRQEGWIEVGTSSKRKQAGRVDRGWN